MSQWFGAVGAVQCPGESGTGQLTLKTDIVTTALHVVSDDSLCSNRLAGESVKLYDECEFRSAKGGRAIRIERGLAHGDGDFGGACGLRGDWAILKLSEPMTDALPYQVALDYSVGARVVSVFASNDDFLRENPLTHKSERVSGLADCMISALYRIGLSFPFGVNASCDGGKGGSGGGLLLFSGVDQPILIGILAGAFPDGFLGSDDHGSDFAPIGAEFFLALQQAAGLSEPPVDCVAQIETGRLRVRHSTDIVRSIEPGSTVVKLATLDKAQGKVVFGLKRRRGVMLYGLASPEDLLCS